MSAEHLARDRQVEADEQLMRELGEAFLLHVTVRVIMGTMDLDQALWRIRHECRKFLGDNGLTEGAAALHLDKSEKQVKRYEKAPEESAGSGNGYALMRAVLSFYVEHPEGATAGQCLGAITDRFPRVSQEDLRELLNFYCKIGYLEREGYVYRAKQRNLRYDPTELSDRLIFAKSTLENLWETYRGYVLYEPGFELKRVRFFVTAQEFQDFLEALREFIKTYMERKAVETSDDDLDSTRQGYELLLVCSKTSISKGGRGT